MPVENRRETSVHDGARTPRQGQLRLVEDVPSAGPGIAVELDAGAEAAAEARAALTALDGQLDADALDDIRLLVSELVTNSVRHSGAANEDRVRLLVAGLADTVRVEVADGGQGFEPRPRTKPRDEAGGWGLHLVDRIADRWGVSNGRGTSVWFEIDVRA